MIAQYDTESGSVNPRFIDADPLAKLEFTEREVTACLGEQGTVLALRGEVGILRIMLIDPAFTAG